MVLGSPKKCKKQRPFGLPFTVLGHFYKDFWCPGRNSEATSGSWNWSPIPKIFRLWTRAGQLRSQAVLGTQSLATPAPKSCPKGPERQRWASRTSRPTGEPEQCMQAPGDASRLLSSLWEKRYNILFGPNGILSYCLSFMAI